MLHPFCLDQPVKSRQKELMRHKKNLEPGALSLLSQFAFFLDGAASGIGEDLSSSAQKKAG